MCGCHSGAPGLSNSWSRCRAGIPSERRARPGIELKWMLYSALDKKYVYAFHPLADPLSMAIESYIINVSMPFLMAHLANNR
jgi:hypothetical protein